MGLPKENADKIIRGFTNQKAIQGLQAGAAPRLTGLTGIDRPGPARSNQLAAPRRPP